jgi:hypothetical protein
MSAVLQIPDHFVTKFDTTWKHLVQQTESRLRETVEVDTFDGKEKKYNQIDSTELDLVTTRAAVTTESDIALPDRWLRTSIYDKAFIRDEWDDTFLGEVSSPTSEFMRAAMQAYNRRVDKSIALALGGTAYTGADGTTGTTLPSAQKVAVNFVAPNTTGSNSGLTLAKLIKARSILRKAEAIAPGERVVFACSQQQIDDLLNNVDQVANTRYADVKALQEGSVTTFMGFYFHITELMPVASSIRSCYAYPQSALKFADGGKKSYMDILPTRSHALQVRVSARLGATRMEEKRVVEIACSEA